MGLFKKKEEPKKNVPELPEIPSLPKITDLEIENIDKRIEELPQLPTFPSNPLGNKFSQDSIKEAISGKKEVDEKKFEISQEPFELGIDKEEKIKKPKINEKKERDIKSFVMPTPKSAQTKTFEFESKSYDGDITVERVNKNEPVFVRIDKFEETKDLFEKTRIKVEEIEKLLREIRRVRTEEEKELQEWETEIYMIKSNIEKVEKDIFSKIE